ncbi:MAG: 50S ribosomal protein L22 [Acidimicrobiia bacterium]
MTGPKLNEGSRVAGERSGTKAQVRYVRVSAYKTREVLNLIRGVDVLRADEILDLCERDVATVIRKALRSAVANAENNDSQSADELVVKACFADEGPTLKRWRPRARGRATRIRKRTTHITIVVARMTDEQLERRRQSEEAKPQSARARRTAASAAAARRERVARSRRAQAGVTEETGGDHEHPDHAHDHPYGEGSISPSPDGSVPEGYPIKGNADSMLYHLPEGRYYSQTKAEVYFATEEAAQAAGFTKQGATAEADDAEEAPDSEATETTGEES